jgi:hypothetical protein
MANANNIWLGAANTSSPADMTAERALFLKIFSGEVLMAFEKQTVVLDKHQVRTIQNGKSASFPVIGRMPNAEYHTPGNEILGQDILQNERIISIDRLLISHVFIDDLDDAMLHYEVRSKYSRMMGQKLAETFDQHIMREIVLAAAASAVVTGLDAGFTVTDEDFDSTTASNKWVAWEDGLFETAENFDNKFVGGTRYCVMKPAYYYYLVRYVQTNGFSAINRDYGGEGSYADGNILRIGGIQLVSSPMLPVADTSGESFHGVDFSKGRAIIFTDEAVGTVKLLDLSLQSEWDIRRQGTLMVARYAMGHGILRPECAARFLDVT